MKYPLSLSGENLAQRNPERVARVPPMRVVAGSGRSGTTWVLDCLADANCLRPIFEPLNPEVSEVGRSHAHRLIDPDDSHPDLKVYLEQIQRSDYRSLWTTYRGLPDRLAPGFSYLGSTAGVRLVHQRWSRFLKSAWKLHKAAGRREPIVKFIRANLALGWLVRNFEAHVVLIVRHPCAVVESKYRLGKLTPVWDPRPLIKRFREDRSFNERTQGAYFDLLNGNLTEHEALALLWVIENQRPIGRAAELGYSVIYYEDLVAEPDVHWPRVCNALALRNLPSAGERKRPSQQSSAIPSANDNVVSAGWMKRMTVEQLHQVQGVLDKTGSAQYQIGSAYPIVPVLAPDLKGAI